MDKKLTDIAEDLDRKLSLLDNEVIEIEQKLYAGTPITIDGSISGIKAGSINTIDKEGTVKKHLEDGLKYIDNTLSVMYRIKNQLGLIENEPVASKNPFQSEKEEF